VGRYKPCQSGGYRPHVPLADGEDTREAIAAAWRAFDKGPWRKMSQVERGKLLLALTFAVREHAEEFA